MRRSLLLRLSWPELRHHPWRNVAALIAVMLGVALAFSVHLINASALAEFGAAVRAVDGEPDLQLVGPRAGFDEALYERVARFRVGRVREPGGRSRDRCLRRGRPARAAARPRHRRARRRPAGAGAAAASRTRGADASPCSIPSAVFLNPQAAAAARRRDNRRRVLAAPARRPRATLASPAASRAGGPPLAVMDIAGAQDAVRPLGRLSRIDVRLAPGADRAAALRGCALPAGVRAAAPDEAGAAVSNVSRAYRVNLTVLALVALFTGAFLVFSILSLSVARRQQQLALLGVLGLAARGTAAPRARPSRRCSASPAACSGSASALRSRRSRLRLFGGDLGGGYFSGVRAALALRRSPARAIYGALGVAAAMVGGWLPARAAAARSRRRRRSRASASTARASALARRIGVALLALGVALALLPPIGGVPLAAYVSVACLLLGGIACVPGGVGLVLAGVAAAAPCARAARRRARAPRARQRDDRRRRRGREPRALGRADGDGRRAFATPCTRWLDVVLPADLYVRAAAARRRRPRDRCPPTCPRAPRAIAGVRASKRSASSPCSSTRRARRRRCIARTLDDPARPPAAGRRARRRARRARPRSTSARRWSRSTAHAPARASRCRCPTAAARRLRARRLARLRAPVRRDRDRRARLAPPDRRRRASTTSRSGSRRAPSTGAVEAALRRRGAASRRRRRAARVRRAARDPRAPRCASSTAASPSPTGCRRWRSRSACSASPRASRRRCWRGARSSACSSHLGLTRRQILAVVSRRRRGLDRRSARCSASASASPSARCWSKVVNPQSFHWTMDLLLPLAAARRALRRGAGGRHADRLAGGARRDRPRAGAGGQGRLVMQAWLPADASPAMRRSSSAMSARASSPSGIGRPLSRHSTALLKPSACAWRRNQSAFRVVPRHAVEHGGERLRLLEAHGQHHLVDDELVHRQVRARHAGDAVGELRRTRHRARPAARRRWPGPTRRPARR